MAKKGKKKGNRANDATTDQGTTTAFAIQDPAAWLRAAMMQAGYLPSGTRNVDRFVNEAVVTPFVAGWNEWKAAHPTTSDQDFWNYVASRNMGLPQDYAGGEPASTGDSDVQTENAFGGASTATSGQPSPAETPLNFQQWLKQEKGINRKQRKGLNKGRRKRLRTQYADFVGGTDDTTPTLGEMDFSRFQTWLQGQMDRYTPQQQGVYDAGKRPSSTRYNYFT